MNGAFSTWQFATSRKHVTNRKHQIHESGCTDIGTWSMR